MTSRQVLATAVVLLNVEVNGKIGSSCKVHWKLLQGSLEEVMKLPCYQQSIQLCTSCTPIQYI